MIEGLKPYAEYKESEVPWMGRVPKDWRVERTKWIFRSRKELNVGRRNTNVLSLTLRGVVNNDPDSPEGMVPKDYATYQLFRKHDLVFKLIDLENIRTSRVGLVHEDGIMSSAYVRLAPSKSANIRFFYFQFFDLYTRAVFNALGAGVRSTLGATDLGELRIAVPPPDEQSAIVRFLDHANRKIDGFIRAKRKLIGLLNEQKQAIIHRAVTRGLSGVASAKTGLYPTVPLKPSGIPWLGNIPMHWEVVRSRRLFTVRTELARTDDVQLSATQSYGVIPQADYEAKIGRRVVKISMHLEKRKHVEKDDFVISMRSFQGGIERAWAAGAIRSSYVVMKPDPSVDVSFFSYVLKSPGYIRALQATGDFIRDGQDLTYGNFRMVDLPLMPLPEQKEIAAYIELATKALEASIARTEREIALMQEYRTRLTADLVTGKLDVREAAAILPNPPADPAAESVAEQPLEEIEAEETE